MAYTDIDDPKSFFNTVLFTGTASGNKAVTGVGFQPDWVWTKNRVDAYGHNLYDSVRGTGKYLQSNGNSAESSSATSMVSFDSDGFTVGTGDNVQYSSNNGVSWNWKAGGTAVSNTDGDITSSVSVNTTAGFSIVSYTGSGTIGNTVGHGLGQKPAMVITKNRDVTSTWVVWHQGGTSTKNTALNSTELEYDSSGSGWSQGINGVPTSSVLSFTAGASGNNNVMDSAEKYISYCFAEKQGFSKFGSYTGNGNASGTFVYTGFKPAWVMIKRTDSTANWQILDNKRNTYNPWNTALFPDTSDPDTTDYSTDHLSNGFKLRVTTTSRNGSGATYIYMAFSENPFVTSTGVPATAR